MAPRPPRKPPAPPSRDRGRTRVPGVSATPQSQSRESLYDRYVLRAANGPSSRSERRALQGKAPRPFDKPVVKAPKFPPAPAPQQGGRVPLRRITDYDTAMAIQEAKEGDDSELLPYQPTPSINPPRPRTVAAGYDPDTKTLRVRFRDGVGYEYYDVPPNVWRDFKRVKSPGRKISKIDKIYEYARADW